MVCRLVDERIEVDVDVDVAEKVFLDEGFERFLLDLTNEESVLVTCASAAVRIRLGIDPLDNVDFFPPSLSALRRSSASSRLDCFAMSAQKETY